MLLKNYRVKKEIKGRVKYIGTNDNNNRIYQHLWSAVSVKKREIYSNTGLTQDIRTISNK